MTTTDDLTHAIELLELAEREQWPLPAPFEQRWSAPSSALLSPAGLRRLAPNQSCFTWLGIVVYLPPRERAESRRAVTAAFERMCESWAETLLPKYAAATHWAKLETPRSDSEQLALRRTLSQLYPLDEVAKVRQQCDASGTLSTNSVLLSKILFPSSQ